MPRAFPHARLPEDVPVPVSVLGTTCGGQGRRGAAQTERQLLRHSQLGPAVSEGCLKHQSCQESASRGC